MVPQTCKPRVSNHKPSARVDKRAWELLLWFKPAPGKAPPQSLAFPTAQDLKSDILWEPMMKFFCGFCPTARHQFLSNLKKLASLVRLELDIDIIYIYILINIEYRLSQNLHVLYGYEYIHSLHLDWHLYRKWSECSRHAEAKKSWICCSTHPWMSDSLWRLWMVPPDRREEESSDEKTLQSERLCGQAFLNLPLISPRDATEASSSLGHEIIKFI